MRRRDLFRHFCVISLIAALVFGMGSGVGPDFGIGGGGGYDL